MQFFDATPESLPDEFTQWLAQHANQPTPSTLVMRAGRQQLSINLAGRVGLGERVLLLSCQDQDSAALRLARAALTPRETEVLYWLARGKTNRDIADICGMKPRTVTKHVEHIFEKLGVETRAAAASLAAREFAETGHEQLSLSAA
jgi:DNA-binding CsgD family transcriptional regulator